jgi:hypothetical protein
MKRWFAGFAPSTARHAVLMAIVITLPSGAALAQGTRAQRMACSGDVWRLCSSAIPSVDRIVACLKREKPHLSAGCQAVFNDPEVQTAINQPPAAAAPGKATPDAQPEQAASTTTAPAPGEVGSAAPERPTIASRSLSTAPPERVASPPAGAVSLPAGAASSPAAVASPPAAVASTAPPARSGAGRTTAARTERVASGEVDSTTRNGSRHGRQQREAYRQGSRRGLSGDRYDRIMAQIAPLVAMAIGGGRRGGDFDVQSMIGGYGGRDDFDVGQIIGMARSMGFDRGMFRDAGDDDWR